jgi:hypothetical protein
MVIFALEHLPTRFALVVDCGRTYDKILRYGLLRVGLLPPPKIIAEVDLNAFGSALSSTKSYDRAIIRAATITSHANAIPATNQNPIALMGITRYLS